MLDPCLPHTCYVVACLREIEIWLGVCNQCDWYISFVMMCQCIPHSMQRITLYRLKGESMSFLCYVSCRTKYNVQNLNSG